MDTKVHVYFKFAHVLKLNCSVKVDTVDSSLSNYTTMDLLNATADHDRQGQVAYRWYRQITHIVEFTSGKGHA